MNVTNDRFKGRQLHIEGYPQMVSMELKEYVEVSACQRITSRTSSCLNNRIVTNFQNSHVCTLDTTINETVQTVGY